MAETAWETKANCAVPCELPNVCWEPVLYTSPNICLPPGANPHTFENYISLHAISFLWLFLAAFIGGFCFGVVLTVSSGIYKCLTRRRCKNTAEISRPANRSTRCTRGFDPLPVPFTSAV
ncbi:hypothetical protein niasHT_006190 [Heterodera trifolii]|uniref:Uncharacterized protein n=1 Tax=Heterodera trifolii TaxID=157864 RepID=A0ABD2M2J1_9BILA